MSILGRFVGGAARSAQDITNKYIDEEIQTNRAKMLADLQRTTAKGMRQDAIDVDFDPRNVGMREAADRSGILNKARAVRGAETEGYNDTDYQGARTAAGDRDAEAVTRRAVESRKTELRELTPLEIKAKLDTLEGTMGAEVKRSGLMAEAAARAQAKFREPRVDAGAEMQKKIGAIEKSIGRKLTENEVMMAVGIAKGRDPERDTETIVEESMNPDGSMTKRTRKEVRRPGGKQAEAGDPILDALMRNRAAQESKGDPKAPAPTTKIPQSQLNELAPMLRGKLLEGTVNDLRKLRGNGQ